MSYVIVFILGVVATVVFNKFWPNKIDKASKELSDEAAEINERLRGDK